MNGCQGSCNQGRTSCDCMRWDGTSRDTQPSDLLPVTPDEMVPLPKYRTLWISFGLVTLCAIGGYIVLPALKGVL